MPKYPIKLGKSMKDGPSPMVEKEPEDKMFYPTLYMEWDDKYDLPDSGEMTVKFRKNSETNRKTKDGERQEVSLDITEITSVKGGKSSVKNEESSEDRLDRLRKEVEDEESEDYED